MNKKRLFFSIICILCMFALLYFAGIIISKIGILRDEYGITGKDNILTTRESILMISLPIIIIILNVITLFFKKMRKEIKWFVLILSICAIAVSATLMVNINTEITDFELQKTGNEELTLSTVNPPYKGDGHVLE